MKRKDFLTGRNPPIEKRNEQQYHSRTYGTSDFTERGAVT
jgi:hypothetical protein